MAELLSTGVRRFSLPALKIPGIGGYRAVDPYRDRINAPNVRRVPLGVDLAAFAPANRDNGWRQELIAGADALIVHCRLSPEKHVERSVDTVAELTESGVAVRLVIDGDGPRRRALERRARGPTVAFLAGPCSPASMAVGSRACPAPVSTRIRTRSPPCSTASRPATTGRIRS